MRKALLISIAAGAALTLSACGESAQNETAEASEAMAGDTNTMGEAVNDTEAAMDAAFGVAENSYDTVANAVEETADDVE
ncbi:hypothetical protein [Stakelama tenebrarum]|uniref:Circumsporozoite protein n=1 Tax=Stakelama tenebrarum TaxID=2711215 RepID=A0A6G6Y2D2_9SPHN|nr:hypothetical protein [Sphingosinithalassobacter tenebrarum]QIG79082.1 hypothetical protein G5C33_04305 [Sphingosinithalassobacter tenebrarum]